MLQEGKAEVKEWRKVLVSLVKKWYLILNTLLVKEYITAEKLSDITQTTSQTLKKNIELLNDQLKGIASILWEKGSYYLYIENYSAFKEIMNGELKKDMDFNSSSKRIAFILKTLLNTKGFVTMDSLAERIEVSRGTVNKDVKNIKKIISDFGISLYGIPNKGIKIVGDELNRRLLLLYYVYDYYFADYKLKKSTVEYIDKIAEEYQLSNYNTAIMKKVVGITLDRVGKGFYINKEIPYYNNYEGNSSFIKRFLYHLEKEYDIALGPYDRDFVIFPVNIRNSAYVKKESMEKYEKGIKDLFNDMIRKIRANFMLELDDNQLFEEMKYHLMFMVNRLVFHIESFNLFYDEIEKKYPFSYELAKMAANVIESRLMISVAQPEISYLAVYFELILYHKDRENRQKQIAIVSNFGKGTSMLIKKQIQEILGPEVTILQFSEQNYTKQNFKIFFAVFTTFPIEIDKRIPVIQVANLFDNNWVISEWNKIEQEQNFDIAYIDFSFTVLDEEKSYFDNVKFMICRLIKDKKLNPNFINLWQEREKKQSTIFEQGIAFPHALNKGFNKIVLSVGVFKNQLFVGNQSIQIVFLAGIPENIDDGAENSLLEMYDLIFRIARRKEIHQKIGETTNGKEFISLLKREGILR